METSKYFHQNSGPRLWWLLILLATIVAVIIAYGDRLGGLDGGTVTPPPVVTPPSTTADWQVYANEQFGFEVKYPPGWRLATFPIDPAAPVFNIYKASEMAAPVRPLTHFDSATHVSIFPHGLPTEGVVGDSQISTVPFAVPTRVARDFLLEDKTPWATFAGLYIQNTSPNFVPEDAGFIWAGLKVDNLMEECTRNGVVVSEAQCDVMTGDQITRRGSVSAADRATQEEILASFRWLERPLADPARDLIHVITPKARQKVVSPLTITGEARGQWFFEASFPVKLVDLQGNEIAVTHAEAQGEWTTTDFVPFQSTLNFTVPVGVSEGVLVLQKDNPSGLSEHDAQFIIPVTF